MSFYPTRNREFHKNNKKIQKTKKHHCGFFSNQNRLGKAKKEIKQKNHSDEFLPDLEQRIPRKQQKNSKNLKTPLWLLSKRKQIGKSWEKEKIKKIVPMSFYPTRNREFHKNNKKIQKTKKHHCGFFSNQNRLGKAKKERKEEKNRSDAFLPDP